MHLHHVLMQEQIVKMLTAAMFSQEIIFNDPESVKDVIDVSFAVSCINFFICEYHYVHL